jgi:hypothetical protein
MPRDTRLSKAGEKMRQIRTSKPKVTWFQGPGPSDLFTLHDDAGAIEEQELTFFGRTVLAKKEQLLTGLCHEGGVATYMGKTGLLDFDSKLNAETLQAALVLLQSIPVKHSDLDAMIRRINDAVVSLET